MKPTDRIAEMSPNAQPILCRCHDPDANYKVFEETDLGPDDTDGRFADVTLERCRSCGRAWLRYFVEYEAFSRSGRWARGLIDEDRARTITPETALDHLNGLEWYLYGGSFFGNKRGRRTGPMFWGAGYGPTPEEVMTER